LQLQAAAHKVLYVAKIDVRNLGDYIREQRSTAEISLRQLATLAGVSNPYLSQIERGLRKPSAEILQQIAKALRISAEALYVQAGILEERYGDTDVPGSILSDAHLEERQKHVLLEIYEAYRRENDALGGDDVPVVPVVETPVARTRKTAARPRPAKRGTARSTPTKVTADRATDA
jgi:transcriptional regulator with XRE-family HTH domain